MLMSGGGIHWSVRNSDLSITGCVVDSNFATYGGGAYLGDYHSGVLMNHSTFENNTGVYGAGVYVTQFNERILFDAMTVRGNAASAAGGGLYVLSGDLSIAHSRFLGNAAPKSGAFYSQAKTVYLDSTLIAGSTGAEIVHLESALSVVVKSAQFFSNTAADGGSFSVTDCEDVSIWNCSFQENIARVSNGGAILSKNSNINVSNCAFVSNTAQDGGGAVHITLAERVLVTGCVFDGNAALNGSGSAVWISSSSDVSIVDNDLYNNRALQGGGTVFWVSAHMSEPDGLLKNNIFSENNRAMYGSAVATDATALTLDVYVYEITNYSTTTPPFTTHVVDFYGEVVRSESEVAVAAVVFDGGACDGYVTGDYLNKVTNGIANFSSLEVYCDPGFLMSVELTTLINGVPLRIPIELRFRECVTGEYYSDRICISCEEGTFSVTDPQNTSLSELTQQQVCRECPDGASACYGNSVFLKDGYWRINNQSTSTLKCPYADSCGGGEGTGDELCTDGYEGNIYRYIVLLLFSLLLIDILLPTFCRVCVRPSVWCVF
jgi:hypothetical protein